MPGTEVRIAESGEIQVRGGTVFKGYFNKPEETEKVLQDGWYSTGDEGRIDGENMLVMTDRMKDLFKTSVGKFVSPQKLELLIGQNKFVEQVIVFGDNRKYITALIVPSFENISRTMKIRGVDVSDPEFMAGHPDVIGLMEKEVAEAQESLASYERIVKFTLLPEPFSIENMGLTSTLKVRRKIIRKQYHDVIEGMYAG
jgi:long-chain acyl-CoA synthetase